MAVTYHATDEQGSTAVELEQQGSNWRFRLGDRTVQADVVQVNPECLSILAGGEQYAVHFLESEGRTVVCVRGEVYDFAVLDEREKAMLELGAGGAAPDAATAGLVRSRIPGKVVSVAVAVGSVVAAGDKLLILEAMKMENELRAAAPGRVMRVLVGPGDTVESGALLLELEPVEAQGDANGN
jgi:biotin carboxyl carrier protein